MKKYMIIDVEDLELVNFEKVSETSAETVRLSVDETKTFVKWIGRKPYFFSKLSNTMGPYSADEMREILTSSEWNGEHPENDVEEFERLSFEEAMTNVVEETTEYAEEE